MQTVHQVFSLFALLMLLAGSGRAAAAPGPLGETRSANFNVTLSCDPSPPIRGIGTLDAIVTDAAGKPVTDALVSFDLNMTNMNHGKNIVVAVSRGDGHYVGQVRYMMPGPWRVLVHVAPPTQAPEDLRFEFKVRFW
jgi:hypothetical protein